MVENKLLLSSQQLWSLSLVSGRCDENWCIFCIRAVSINQRSRNLKNDENSLWLQCIPIQMEKPQISLNMIVWDLFETYFRNPSCGADTPFQFILKQQDEVTMILCLCANGSRFQSFFMQISAILMHIFILFVIILPLFDTASFSSKGKNIWEMIFAKHIFMILDIPNAMFTFNN